MFKAVKLGHIEGPLISKRKRKFQQIILSIITQTRLNFIISNMVIKCNRPLYWNLANEGGRSTER